MNEGNFNIKMMQDAAYTTTVAGNIDQHYGSRVVNTDGNIVVVSNTNMSKRLLTTKMDVGETLDGGDDQLRIWLSAIPLVALMAINVLANGAIIVIFIKQKCIRRCRNIYILSIAVADFFIGLSMPLSIVETLNTRWTFWPFACWVFLMVRYSLFFISFISIILLTLDRWWSINFPFSYRVRQSRTMAGCIVICCWLVSFILHIPLVLGWDDLKVNEYNTGATYCRIPKERNFIFTICAFVIEYLVPMGFLFVLNLGIYMKLLRRRNTTKLRRSLSTTDAYMLYSRKTSSDSGGSTTNNNTFDESSEVSVFSNNNGGEGRRHTVYLYTSRKMSTYSSKVPKNMKSSIASLKRPPTSRRLSVDTAALLKAGKHNVGMNKQFSFPTRKQSDEVVKDYLVRQDKKAILSLGLLTMVAFVCWTPYAITSMVHAFCPSCMTSWISVFFYWILAANSAINPFLYGIGNPDFRKVLRTWVSCCNYPNYKLQDTLLYCQLQQNAELETLQEYNTIQTKNASL